jgi:hypothetical protein
MPFRLGYSVRSIIALRPSPMGRLVVLKASETDTTHASPRHLAGGSVAS